MTDKATRRHERREKQRAANIGRAATMHAARLAWQREGRQLLFPESAPPELEPLQIGCSGWFYWHWRGGFYPENLPTRDWFEHYAERFHTVELNAPFYSWPTVGAVKTWMRQVGPRRFAYTVKVSELITHIKRFEGTKTLIRDFGYIADVLGPLMGSLLFQLPPSFHYTPARLRSILEQLDPARRNVVEFRHISWWNESVYDAFRRHGIIFCSVSGPKLPDDIIETADEIYLRFHGPKNWYRHNYEAEELAGWAERIRACGAKRVWAYFNNDQNCFAIHNALELERQLRGIERRSPAIQECR